MRTARIDYLIIDLPDDGEIATDLVTEGQLIETILGNRRRGKIKTPLADVKRLRIASKKQFATCPKYSYEPRCVHLGGHGTEDGMLVLGGSVSWNNVALFVKDRLKPLPPVNELKCLRDDSERSVFFSCCESQQGFNKTRSLFHGYFSGAFYLEKKTLGFTEALAISAMFYSKLGDDDQHGVFEGDHIVDKINQFMGKKVLKYERYPEVHKI